MRNGKETEEREYLAHVQKELQRTLAELEGKVSDSYRDIIEAKKYLWVNMAQLDAAERAANRVDISLSIDAGEKTVARLQKIRKLLGSPYFGRVDFRTKRQPDADAYYIGIHSFVEEESQHHLIYDWRSPVASLFYDYETGPASYLAPAGIVDGEITAKRQYKIKDGVLEYMIESSMNIHDDVLQKELSSTSDEKMKNIVATIQQEQNAIIRNENANELIIQGAAGSGKTSVALHRVAYLLYRYKETLRSSDILIISPNKVFSDYISNVLPELGEEKIMEAGMEELAEKELAGVWGFQTFYEQVEELLNGEDPGSAERIRYKARREFVLELEAFMSYADKHFFEPADILMDRVQLPAHEIWSVYERNIQLPVKQRLEKTALLLAAGARTDDGERLTKSETNKIKTAVKKMYKFQQPLGLYKAFYAHANQPELFKMKGKGLIEYADVFPLIYLKMYLEGSSPYDRVRHLLVDEMQDYTPVQYAVLSRWFPCKKTILGDSKQSVNVYSSSTLQTIKTIFPQADIIELSKSYRSTREIMEFAKEIQPGGTMIPIDRHGEPPRILSCDSHEQELDMLRKLSQSFLESDYHTMGIICKTRAQARQVYDALKHLQENVHLLDFESEQFREGITVTCSHMAKGLEFDQVAIPFVNAACYRSEMDRSLLYIACTRAMHALAITHTGRKSPWLP